MGAACWDGGSPVLGNRLRPSLPVSCKPGLPETWICPPASTPCSAPTAPALNQARTPHTCQVPMLCRPWTPDHPGGCHHGLGPCHGGCRDTQPCLASPVWLSTRQPWGHPHPDPGGGSEGSPALWGRPLGAGTGLGSGVMRPSADPEGPEVVTSPSPPDGRETEAPRGGSVARPPPVPALARPLAQHRSY